MRWLFTRWTSTDSAPLTAPLKVCCNAHMVESSFGNVHEYSVSELSGAIKRAIEEGFGFVRVRGELGRVTRPASGHVYLDLKDEKAVLSGVLWKGNAQRLKIAPEQGMEVIATGRISTFPGQSRYQIIIDSLEPAGVGALMALYEERKKKLQAEGLFAAERKKQLPFLPRVIGVVTSPSGAVIRDILHRLRDRFPSHVIVWPTLVQGRGAETKIAEAIAGFNALPMDGDIPRPDVLIVARGGGSLEDLWCFNEEAVARAAAASEIPLISAVGHETDTTLIDFVADKRAPTPTAAAEMAVPVRSELLSELLNKERRMIAASARGFDGAQSALRSAARGLGRPEDIFGPASQRLDRAIDGLHGGLRRRAGEAQTQFARIAGRLGRQTLSAGFVKRRGDLGAAHARLARIGGSFLDRRREKLSSLAQLLGSLSHQGVLQRGFVLVKDQAGGVIRRVKEARGGDDVTLVFADGEAPATFMAGAIKTVGSSPFSKTKKTVRKPKAGAKTTGAQKTLFD